MKVTKKFTLKRIEPMKAALIFSAFTLGLAVASSILAILVQVSYLRVSFFYQLRFFLLAMVGYPVIVGLSIYIACICFNWAARLVGGLKIHVDVEEDG